jgi:hypothetical protein
MSKLPIKIIFKDKEYFCSENSLATLNLYYGKITKPEDLHNLGCLDFKTIRKCVSKFFERKRTTLSMIKKSINQKHPVLVSIIPDANLKTLREKGLDSARHTVLVYGYTENNLLVVDDGVKKRIGFKNFIKIWKRTDNDTWIRKDI